MSTHHISLHEASRLTPYDANYLGLLVRNKRLSAVKKKGKWYTTETAVKQYLSEVSEKSLAHYGNQYRRSVSRGIGFAGSVFAPIILIIAIGVFVIAEGASSSFGEDNFSARNNEITFPLQNSSFAFDEIHPLEIPEIDIIIPLR